MLCRDEILSSKAFIIKQEEKKKVTVFKSMRVVKCSSKEHQRRADNRNY